MPTISNCNIAMVSYFMCAETAELEEIDTTPHKERIDVGKGVAIDKLVAAE